MNEKTSHRPDWEKIFTKRISDKELDPDISEKERELSKLDN